MKATESWRAENLLSTSFVITGLPARQILSDSVKDVISKGEQAAVLVIKVGDLGQINHVRGYDAGDEVIRELVNRISYGSANIQFVGRLGGGHFLALARGSQNADGFCGAIEHLVNILCQPIHLASGPVYLSCTVGASITPADSRLHEELLCNAELALRSANRGSYAFYSPQLRDQASDQMAIRSALAGALERDEFYLVYQPQICLETGRIFGVEALLRWQSAHLGLVSPGRFIPVAEAAGMMPIIGNWVLKQACNQARQWLEAHTPIRVAVNVCAAQLEAGNFVESVRQALAETQLPAHLLELEVTESMLVQQVQINRDALSAIRDTGVKLGLDDFGTGYSSLAYLSHFTFDTLKIDRLFVSALTQERHADVLVRAIIALGQELGHEIIAEGIETEVQKNALMEMGCTRMQGFFFGHPVLARDVFADDETLEAHP